MRPIQVTVSGFRAYGSEKTINFNDGLTAIVGPNKSGKSSTFLAIMWALYGPAALRDIGITQGDCVHEGYDRCRVQLQFEAGGIGYLLNREYLASGTTKLTIIEETGAIFANVQELHEAIDRTGATVRETQATINALVGEYSVAAQSWYCGQDADKSFMFAPPSERMEVFSALLPSRTNWDALHDAAKAQRVIADNDVIVCVTQIGMLKEQVAEIELFKASEIDKALAMTAARTALTAAEAELTRLQAEAEGMQKRKAAQTALSAAESVYETHDKAYEYAQLMISRQDQINDDLADEGEAVLASEAESASYAMRSAERHEWGLARQIADYELEISQHDIDKCPTCKRGFGPDDADAKDYADEKARVLRRQLEAIQEARDIIVRVDITRGQPEALPLPKPFQSSGVLAADKIELGKAFANIDALENVYRSSRESLDSAKAALEELGEGMESALGFTEVQRAMTSVLHDQELVVQGDKRDVESAVTAHARATERLETARKAVTTLAETETALSAAQERLNDYELLVRATGPRGVRQLAVSQALAGINSTANRVLDVVDPGTQIYLDTQRETGDGSQAETLEATIIGPDGMASFGTRSGAEKSRIALAVRIALEVARAQSLGSESNATIILDEAFSAQDTMGKANYVQLFRWLTDTLGVNILLVTHDSELREMFDQVIEIEKIDGEAVVK